MPRVLVTGATGLVGRVLCAQLSEAGYTVRAVLRGQAALAAVKECVVLGDITRPLDWSMALDTVELVVHAAARTHIAEQDTQGAAYLSADVFGARQLAAAAARRGVRRFVYVSSVKAMGEESGPGGFTASTVPAPVDRYGRAKLEAERAVCAAAEGSPMQVAVIRPPLVYGPGVQANFLKLLRWVDRERPLPFAAVHNRRSLISVWNLCHLVRCTLEHPHAAGTWLASDGEDLSTPELVRRLARALRRRARLLPVPTQFLALAGRLCGRQAQVQRLCGSLVVDTSPLRDLLGWSPLLTVDEGLTRTAAWYRAAGSG